MLEVVFMATQILPHQLRIASDEVDLGRTFCVKLQLNCIFKEIKANFSY